MPCATESGRRAVPPAETMRSPRRPPRVAWREPASAPRPLRPRPSPPSLTARALARRGRALAPRARHGRTPRAHARPHRAGDASKPRPTHTLERAGLRVVAFHLRDEHLATMAPRPRVAPHHAPRGPPLATGSPRTARGRSRRPCRSAASARSTSRATVSTRRPWRRSSRRRTWGGCEVSLGATGSARRSAGARGGARGARRSSTDANRPTAAWWRRCAGAGCSRIVATLNLSHNPIGVRDEKTAAAELPAGGALPARVHY